MFTSQRILSILVILLAAAAAGLAGCNPAPTQPPATDTGAAPPTPTSTGTVAPAPARSATPELPPSAAAAPLARIPPTTPAPAASPTPKLAPSPTPTWMWFKRTPAPVIPAPPGLVYELPAPSGNSETDWLVDSTGRSIPWEAHLFDWDAPVYRLYWEYGGGDTEGTPGEGHGNLRDVYFFDPQTGEERNITNTPDREEWLTGISLNDPEIVLLYSRTITEIQELGEGPEVVDLVEARADGTRYTILADTYPGLCQSPDGQTIAFYTYGNGWLYDIEAGARPFPLEAFGLSADFHGLLSPGWSPAENTIVWWMGFYTGTGSTNTLGIFNLETYTVRLLHDFYPVVIQYNIPDTPEWSPDGQWIAYLARKSPSGASRIWVIDVDGDMVHTFGEFYGEENECELAWSPDSQWLAFSCAYPENSGIWLVQTSDWKIYQADLPAEAEVWEWIEPGP